MSRRLHTRSRYGLLSSKLLRSFESESKKEFGDTLCFMRLHCIATANNIMVLYHTKQINSMLSWVYAVIDHHKMTSICGKWKICVVGESLFEGDIIIKRFKGQFFMIVGIATTMAIKMTKIPWRGFGCSSKLLLSPSSAVEDLEHPDELFLRPRVGAFTSSPPLPE